MKSSYLINLILALLVITLYWFNNLDDTQPVVETITTSTIADITTLSIIRPNKHQVDFSKIDATWFMQSPLYARANKTRIDLLLSLLSAPIASSQEIEPQMDLSQFGFNDDSPSIRLNKLEFKFGAIEAISKQRYVLHNKKLYLTQDRIAPLLNVNDHSFIENQLLSPDKTIIHYRLPTLDKDNKLSPKVVNLYQENGQWHSSVQQTTQRLKELVDSWQYAQALQVLPLSRLDLHNNKTLTIELIFDDQPESVRSYQVLETNKALFIIDNQSELVYQFVPELKHQLFLKK